MFGDGSGTITMFGAPSGARIADAKVDTSVRDWEITIEAGASLRMSDNQTSNFPTKITVKEHSSDIGPQ